MPSLANNENNGLESNIIAQDIIFVNVHEKRRYNVLQAKKNLLAVKKRNYSTIHLPISVALCKGVAPSLSLAWTSAPWLNSCHKICSWPLDAHKCNGVRAYLSRELTRFSSLPNKLLNFFLLGVVPEATKEDVEAAAPKIPVSSGLKPCLTYFFTWKEQSTMVYQ